MMPLMGSYDENSERIFICGVVNHAIASGDLRIGVDLEPGKPWQEILESAVVGAAKAWRSYEATGRRGNLDRIRAGMEFSSTLDELYRYARELTDLPMTSAERKTSEALYKTRLEAIQREQNQ